MKRVLLAGAGLLLLAAAAFVVPTVWFQPWSVDHFYARVFIQYALRHPMLLTQLGILNGVPFGDWRDRLDDFSPAAEAADQRYAEDNLARLRRYDRAKMTPAARLSADVLEWYLSDAVELDRFREHDYPVNQLFGFQSELPAFMLTSQPLRTPRDAESYVRRVTAFPRAFDQTVERLRVREAKGVVPPRFVLREVREQMERFIAKPPGENELFVRFRAATDTLEGLAPARRDGLREELRRALETGAYPAYRRLLAFVARQESLATDDDGVWKLPDGDACYDGLLRHYTTSTLPADSIHALGLREVARLQSDMRALFVRAKVRPGPFAAQMAQVRRDSSFAFPAGDEGRAQILARYREILDDASRRCDSLFDVHPRGSLAVERVPPFKEATSAGAYYDAGAFDGSRPGVFFANLRNPAETRRPDLRTLAYHEGIPGHHFQVTIAQEMKGVPFFRRVIPFTAYVEGWALYAERVALEQGFHRDVYDSLGAMQAELFRAVRLVVDTGIHRSRWTRQQAIDYMVSNTGMDTAAVVSEVERYIVMPGQACAYKVGQLEILALRRHAMDRLGSQFDLRKFHNVVLTNGALPLTLLARVVDEWIERELRSGHARTSG